ncbi:hypothetical protein ACI6QG_16930 [Roseococcus sp. DSY-14]|uniref:hypothetical protein n=1 Tax=Roseococcus sp. DSY-14 TaxID=3369650 RepID=UPI00387AE2A6
MSKVFQVAAVLGGLTLATAASAAPVIYNNSIPAGTAAFSTTVTGAGGTVQTQVLGGLASGNTWVTPAFTITSTDGSTRPIDTTYLSPYGDAIGINPVAPAAGSGLTFTFNAPVNAFGLMVGDWATCCYLPSELLISFDGGATRTVASAFSSNDNPGIPAGDGYRNFVAAIDTSAKFTTVTFYGNGFGEYLVAGGTIYYADLAIGSVNGVPVPGAVALMAVGLLGLGAATRRKAA